MDESQAGSPPARTVGALADRLGIGPWSVVVGALAVLAAAIGGWWALAAPDPPPPEDVLPRADEVVALVTTSTTSVPLVVVVHVDGAVVAPGVHEVAIGARVVDAVDAAGGLDPAADRSRLNLAAPLADGQRIWVPAMGEEEPAVVLPDGGTTDQSGLPGGPGPIDLNAADQSTLETLPGIGPTIAAAIVEHRERDGAFRSVEGLLDVAGIGPARLAQLESLVTT